MQWFSDISEMVDIAGDEKPGSPGMEAAIAGDR
jgi:hypothetical protein